MTTGPSEILFEALEFLLRAKNALEPGLFSDFKDYVVINGWYISSEAEYLLSHTALTSDFIKIEEKVHNSQLHTGVQKLAYSIYFLEKLSLVTRDVSLFKEIVRSLKFENSFMTFVDVSQSLNQALEKLPHSSSNKIRRLFIENILKDTFGFSSEDYLNAASILEQEKLYIDALFLLQYHISQNHFWEHAYESVRHLIGLEKPESQQPFEMFLWQHHAKKTSSDPENWYESYCDYTFIVPDQAPVIPLDIGDILSKLSL